MAKIENSNLKEEVFLTFGTYCSCGEYLEKIYKGNLTAPEIKIIFKCPQKEISDCQDVIFWVYPEKGVWRKEDFEK